MIIMSGGSHTHRYWFAKNQENILDDTHTRTLPNDAWVIVDQGCSYVSLCAAVTHMEFS